LAQVVQDTAAVDALVQAIKSPVGKVNAGCRPICVVTIAVDATEPAFDLDYLESQCLGAADFFVMQTGDLTRHFEGLMPVNSKVFGGAARAYRADFAQNPVAGKLHFGVPASLLAKSQAGLISEIWGYAYLAGLVQQATPNQKLEKATVKTFIGAEMAMVQLTDGSLAQVYAQQQFPGVPVAAFLRIGQEIEGHLISDSRQFAIASEPFDSTKLLEVYPYGSVVLGLVTDANRKTATVAIHPSFPLEIPKARITHNERDVVSEYLEVGRVYSFRIFKDDHSKPQLRCDDIEDFEEPLQSVALLPGGVPWLNEVEGLAGSASAEPAETVSLVREVEQSLDEIDAEVIEQADGGQGWQSGGVAQGSTQEAPTAEQRKHGILNDFAVAHYRGKIKLLNNQMAGQNDAIRRLEEENRNLADRFRGLENQLREAKVGLIEARRQTREATREVSVFDPWDSRDNFATDEEWLRHEVYLAWVEAYSPTDRKRFNLQAANWTVNPNFFDNLSRSEFNGGQLRKVIKTIVDVVTGREAQDHINKTHALFENGRPIVIGSSRALRAYVEEVAASARRLHYWQFKDGSTELSQVAVHDDYNIYAPTAA
jgi:hypothetical protein